MPRKLLFRLLAAALALVAVVAALELGLRLLPVGRQPLDTAVREVPRPSAADQPQFRRPGWEGEKKGERFRIVVVGDSFTWGDGVYPEDTYPARLERRLQALAPSIPVQVVNWSRRGWNTAQEWLSIHDELDRLDPDLLLLGYCINDAEAADPKLRRRLWREQGWWPGDEPEPGWLARRSRLAGRLRTSLLNLRSRRAARAYYHRIYDEVDAWQENRAALVRFGTLDDEGAFPFLLLIFPIFDSQLDDRYPYRELHSRVEGIALENEIPYLDLLDAYRGVDARRLAVTPFTDPHPNELAHRIAADRIVDELVERGWVPAEALRQIRRRAAARRAAAEGSP